MVTTDDITRLQNLIDSLNKLLVNQANNTFVDPISGTTTIFTTVQQTDIQTQIDTLVTQIKEIVSGF